MIPGPQQTRPFSSQTLTQTVSADHTQTKDTWLGGTPGTASADRKHGATWDRLGFAGNASVPLAQEIETSALGWEESAHREKTQSFSLPQQGYELGPGPFSLLRPEAAVLWVRRSRPASLKVRGHIQLSSAQAGRPETRHQEHAARVSPASSSSWTPGLGENWPCPLGRGRKGGTRTVALRERTGAVPAPP